MGQHKRLRSVINPLDTVWKTWCREAYKYGG